MSDSKKKLVLTKDLIEITDLVKLVKEGCASLETKLQKMSGTGVNARSKEATLLENTLDVVLSKCQKLVDTTGKKSYVNYFNKSKAAAEKDAKRQRDFLRESRNGTVEAEDSIFVQLKKHVDANVPKKKPSVVSPSSGSSSKSDSSQRPSRLVQLNNFSLGDDKEYPRKKVNQDGTINILQSNKVEHNLPAPLNGSCYSISEYVIMMDDLISNEDLKGYKQLTVVLNELKMLKLSYPMFKNLWDNYIQSGRDVNSLPDNSRLVLMRGRKRKLEFDKIAEECNERNHKSVSLVTDPYEDATTALAKANKNNSQGQAVPIPIVHARATVNNYSTVSIMNDDNISLTNLDTCRIKSMSRVIASESSRTLACHCLGIILAQFRVGVWHDVPKNLSKGALAAVKLAKVVLNSQDVYPIDMRYIVSFDQHGYRYIKGKNSLRSKSQRDGKTSNLDKHSEHNQKKISSNWRDAKSSDNHFKGISLKESEVNSASGHRGRKCLNFTGFTKEELPSGLLILEVPGLGYGLDMKANHEYNDFGFVIFSCHSDSSKEDEFSLSVKVSQFITQNVILPFIDELRKGDTVHKWDPSVPVPEKMSCAFKLDSDVPFLTILKHPDTVNQFRSKNIVVQKTAAGFTECGSANDRQQLFKNNKLNQRSNTCIEKDTALKDSIIEQLALAKHRSLFNPAGWKKENIIDAVATNNIINDKSCRSRETIQDGFVSTGEISRTESGEGFNSCCDLYAIIATSKNRKLLKNPSGFEESLYKIAKEYGKHGCCSEEFFDSVLNEDGTMVFPIDREPSGKKREKVFSLDQYQLMRTMLPHHNNFVQVQEMKRQELHHKRKDAILKAYHDTMTIFELNKVCEENVLTGSKRSSLSDCSVLHFYNLAKKEELLSFVTVRMFKDLCDTAAKDLTTRKKGKPADFDARTELEDEIGGTVTLLEIAFKMRMKPVLATAPQTPQIPNDSVSSIPIPIVAQMNKSKNFVLDETWIKSVFNCISNFKVHDDNFLQTSLSSIELLRHDLLEKMISNRLAIHLSKYPGIKIGSQEWRFIFANIGRVSVILKLLQYVRPDATLKTTRETETLLSPSFIKDHEELAESHAKQHGCFIVFDPHRGSAILVGTAPNKFGHKSLPGQSSGQYNLHECSSKQRSSSIFYNAYPHKDLAVKVDGLHRGVFQDLEFVPVIRFEHTDRENVQSLFEWDDDVVQMLKNKKISDYKTLSDKKHLLVCYLFESTIQMCLTPIDDLAENPGCGSFSSVSNS